MADVVLDTLSASAALPAGASLLIMKPDATTPALFRFGAVIPAAVATTSRIVPRIVTVAGPVTILAGDGLVVINQAVLAAVQITLEANPLQGAVHRIADGNDSAAQFPHTITPASGTINRKVNTVNDVPGGVLTVEYTGTEWIIT